MRMAVEDGMGCICQNEHPFRSKEERVPFPFCRHTALSPLTPLTLVFVLPLTILTPPMPLVPPLLERKIEKNVEHAPDKRPVSSGMEQFSVTEARRLGHLIMEKHVRPLCPESQPGAEAVN